MMAILQRDNNAINSDHKKLRCAPLFTSGYGGRQSVIADMPYVVLQQVSSSYAKHNAAKTLDKPVALKYLEKYYGKEEWNKLKSSYESGVVYLWGAKFERHHQIHKMIPRQTLVLFRRGKTVFRCAVIQDLFVKQEMAENIWGVDSDGETWGIVFLMSETKQIKLSAEEVNSIIGRKPNDNWQGMTSVDGEKAEKLIDYVKEHINAL